MTEVVAEIPYSPTLKWNIGRVSAQRILSQIFPGYIERVSLPDFFFITGNYTYSVSPASQYQERPKTHEGVPAQPCRVHAAVKEKTVGFFAYQAE
jgi:hypothetical protein